jgi:hypothetical protein
VKSEEPEDKLRSGNPLKSLTFEAFRDLLASVFKQIPDSRDERRITWEMPTLAENVLSRSPFQAFVCYLPALRSYAIFH